MFWNGQDPGWYGDGQAPSWNSATVKSFLAHAPVDMFGIMQYPFSGSCSPADLGQVFEGTKLLGSIGRKPILSWIDLVTASAAPSCHAKNLTASQASSQIFAAVESGAQGVVFSTLNTDSGTSVPPVAASSAANSTSRLRTLLPCLLTGKAVTAEVSSKDVVTRACKYGGYTYILATNISDKPVKVGLRVGTKAGTATVLWEGRRLVLSASRITDRFKPLQTHIYSISR